jgi:hypothetical protein
MSADTAGTGGGSIALCIDRAGSALATTEMPEDISARIAKFSGLSFASNVELPSPALARGARRALALPSAS